MTAKVVSLGAGALQVFLNIKSSESYTIDGSLEIC